MTKALSATATHNARLWFHREQEQDGNYFFSGQRYMTRTIAEELSEMEIQQIIQDIQKRVKEKRGADYFQVFENAFNSDRKIFVIDNLSQDMIQEAKDAGNFDFLRENHYFTIMFAEEY